MPIWPLILIVLPAFAILFVTIWSGVSLLLSVLGGWRSLGHTFPDRQQDTSGELLPWRSARIGLVRYKGCLSMRATTQGLHTAPVPFFRTGHPPLFIPWSQFFEFTDHGYGHVSAQIGQPAITSIVTQLPPHLLSSHLVPAEPPILPPIRLNQATGSSRDG